MGKFNFITTAMDGLLIIEPTLFGDDRGYFMESYNLQDFQAAGLDVAFVQDNESRSRKGVLRGLHFQINYPQGKLIRVTKGSVFDVSVDVRLSSSTFGQWLGIVLSEE
ncbi:MAG: dTDP-4-dehydrorhamnose 3,5-epimerase family protein, partial [Ignavibacteriales bacterium]